MELEILKNFVKDLAPAQCSFFERVYAQGIQKYSDRIKQYGFSKFKSVLDAGSGFGQWSIALSGVNDKVTAVEYNKDRVDISRKVQEHIGINNLSFMQGSIEELNFASSSFDAVFCYGVIFLTDWKKSLAELCRVLESNGLLYVNANGIGWYYNLIVNEHNKGDGYNPRELGINAFINTDRYKRGDERMLGIDIIISPEEFESELAKNGCKIIFKDAEGKIKADNNSTSFFAGEYFGEIGVYEIIAMKVAD